ncbi:PH domain-containing protein [Streptomyces sp. NBC_00820]|uniref:PH domain-containing protein n=1 Tax=Streptomyces sp. NBC_00820 TaxID=2975842 RepID=UPI002ED4D0DD|nr:PH domain-containing protein [Streptomyces sp. NBC_00820]
MNELIFRTRDRYRVSWRLLAPLGIVLAIQGFRALRGLSTVAFSCLTGAIVVLWAVGFFSTIRSRTTVGADGITIYWGIGRARRHPWHEIRWIDVRETKSNYGPIRTARITLADGRRRSLPGLTHSNLHPSPDFAVDFQRVVNWWELSTDRSERVQPPKRPRDRMSPQVAGVLIGLVATAVVALVVFVRHA